MRLMARWISIALHPVFLSFYAVLLLFALDPHLSFFLVPRLVDLPLAGEVILWDQHLLFIMIFVMTVLFPAGSAILLLRGGAISDLNMPSRGERIAPYLLTLFYHGLGYWLLRRSDHHEMVVSMFAGGIVVLALVAAITLRWKISAHMAGIGGLVGALCGAFALHGAFPIHVIAGAVVVAGLLGSARMLDGDHTLGQVLAGSVLGCSIVLLFVLGAIHP
jgi:hypothetical protein